MTVLFLCSPQKTGKWIIVHIPRLHSQQLLVGEDGGGEGILAIYQGAADKRLQVWLSDKERWLSQFSGFGLISS